ncbi:Ribonuclease T2-like protein [Corchorus olitorius]|uniref:Ribonuclease T2-like protein n=1 Tax=Corchorus olitorius TaxID=93759 RepID=A0A1R3IEZ1_9ROSI|nr:Ribonuclease T2-like protein [Corchorus olitorius]
MSLLWPNLNPFDDRKFWEDEWQLHGSCQNNDPYRYFSTAIALMKTIKLDQALKEKIQLGIIKPKALFISTIQEKVGNVTPILTCIKKDGVYLLKQIILCVDTLGKTFISCDQPMEQDYSCQGYNIKFPKFPDWIID